jgi:3alpha(or 20beta)-hydroxysteroid dehydrogenase
MSARLEGTCGIVSGAASGIGRAVAQLFAAEGAHVIAADLDLAALQRLERRATLEVAALDVTDPDSWQTVVARAVNRAGPDFLVNCAGVSIAEDTIDGCAPSDWRRVIAVNLDGTFLGNKVVAEAMRDGGRGGSIINISSVLGAVADGGTLAYGASKSAVRGLTRSVALAGAPLGIRCNAIMPGYIHTPMTNRWFEEAGITPDELAALHPLNRLGQPEEVAHLALFLASGDASFVTGVDLAVDGGYLAV